MRGTPLDFNTPHGHRRPGFTEIKAEPVGYDHNYVLRGGGPAALHSRPGCLSRGQVGVLEVFTTEPGVQLYTGNFLDGTVIGKGGVAYKQHQAFCLEAQHFPDSVHQPELPDDRPPNPGQTYRQTTVFKFSTR